MIDIPSSLAVTGIKADYTITYQKPYSGNYATTLFNGVVSASDRIGLWGQYCFQIKVYEKVNIGIYASAYNDTGYLCVKNLSTGQVYSKYGSTSTWDWKWYVFYNLPAGTYQIYINSNATFYLSEMYIESLAGGCLIKENSNYYSIKDEYYNTETKTYEPIENFTTDNIDDYGFQINELFEEKTINEETFKPFDKFNCFSIVSKENNSKRIKGIKSNLEIINSKQTLSANIAHLIRELEVICTLVGNGNIKVIVSRDKGSTWSYWDTTTNAWLNLANTVTKRDYNSMTDTEKEKWEALKQEAWQYGMTPDVIKIADFESIKDNGFKFAFVLSRPTYADNATLKELDWTYDEDGGYIVLNNTDILIKKTDKYIKLVPQRNMENIKVEIVN